MLIIMASKWRLNKAEERQVQAEGEEAKAQKIASGGSEHEGDEAKENKISERTLEIKQSKADASAAKRSGGSTATVKAKAKAKGAIIPDPSRLPKDLSNINHGYYTRLCHAIDVIQGHKIFARVAEEAPLKISAGGSQLTGVQAGGLPGCILQ